MYLTESGEFPTENELKTTNNKFVYIVLCKYCLIQIIVALCMREMYYTELLVIKIAQVTQLFDPPNT